MDGGVKPERVFRHAGVHEPKHEEAGLHRYYRFDVVKAVAGDPEHTVQRRVLSAVASLKAHPTVRAGTEHVEAELAVRLLYKPDDPMYDVQSSDHYSLVNLEAAWNVTTGDPSVVVQVVDSGMDMNHPDLQSNVWNNTDETNCTDGVDNDGNGFVDDCWGYNHADDTGSFDDLFGSGSHGTHVAGKI